MIESIDKLDQITCINCLEKATYIRQKYVNYIIAEKYMIRFLCTKCLKKEKKEEEKGRKEKWTLPN